MLLKTLLLPHPESENYRKSPDQPNRLASEQLTNSINMYWKVFKATESEIQC